MGLTSSFKSIIWVIKNAKVIQTSSCASFRPFSYKVATDLDTLNGCSEDQVNLWSGDNYAYGQSKLAQILWVKALTRRLGPSSTLSANAFHPGLANTPGVDKAMDSGKIIDFQRNLIHRVVTKSAWQSPDGALTGLFLAVTDGIKGKYFHPQAQEVVNPMSLDEQLQDDLWAFSDKLVENYLSPLELSQADKEEPGADLPPQHDEKQEKADLANVEGVMEAQGATKESASTIHQETFSNEL